MKIEISEEARAVAEREAAASGFATADAYVEALLLGDVDDLDAIVGQPWFVKKIEEGEASPIVGELTPERITQLVQQGIARAKRDK
ncbi:MAG: hypothetical protein WDN03_03615 [Rhizomicrobium sp.]